MFACALCACNGLKPDRRHNHFVGARLRRAITVAPMVHRSPLRCADRATKPCSYQPMAVDSEGRFWAAFYFDRSGFVRLGLRSCLDRPGFRPGGRLTFLSRDKKVSKETRPPRRPFGVPSLRTLSAGGPANSLRSDMQGRTTPPSTFCARRLTREGHTEPGIEVRRACLCSVRERR